MDLTSRQSIGAVVLIISGIAAFAAPFLIHSPPTQGGTGTNNNDDNNNNGGSGSQGTGGGGGQGAGPKKSMQDLMNAIGSCQGESHGNSESSGYTRSLQAKVYSAMRSEHSTRTDHHLAVLDHKLGTPSAEKHAGGCIDGLRDLIDELMTGS